MYTLHVTTVHIIDLSSIFLIVSLDCSHGPIIICEYYWSVTATIGTSGDLARACAICMETQVCILTVPSCKWRWTRNQRNCIPSNMVRYVLAADLCAMMSEVIVQWITERGSTAVDLQRMSTFVGGRFRSSLGRKATALLRAIRFFVRFFQQGWMFHGFRMLIILVHCIADLPCSSFSILHRVGPLGACRWYKQRSQQVEGEHERTVFI